MNFSKNLLKWGGGSKWPPPTPFTIKHSRALNTTERWSLLLDKRFLVCTIFMNGFYDLDFGYHLQRFLLFQVLFQKYRAVNLVEKVWESGKIGFLYYFCSVCHSMNKFFHTWLNNGSSVVNLFPSWTKARIQRQLWLALKKWGMLFHHIFPRPAKC